MADKIKKKLIYNMQKNNNDIRSALTTLLPSDHLIFCQGNDNTLIYPQPGLDHYFTKSMHGKKKSCHIIANFFFWPIK